MKKPLLTVFLGLFVSSAFAFSFSEEEQKQKDAEHAARRAARAQVADLLSVPCRQSLKDKTIMIVVGERTARGMYAEQSSYSAHFNAIDRRLKNLGLNTVTQAQMKARIAQAEITAYLNNDMDAALNASKKMGADFILRGVISSRTAYNPMVRLPEVYINMNFTLTGANGRTISEVSAHNESYSGNDTSGMALTLINEKAAGVVAHLYNDYCTSAGIIGRRN